MSSWGLVFREGRQRKETGQPQSWSAHPPRRGLYPRRRAKRGTGAHRLPNKSKATCPYFISSFQKQFSRVGEVPCPPPFPRSYCYHLSSLNISYWLSSKGDETEISHFSLPTPRTYPALNRGKESYAKGTSFEAARLILISLVPRSPKSFDLIPRSKRHQGTYKWMKTLSK